MFNMRIFKNIIILILLTVFCVTALHAQNPTIEVSIDQINAEYNDAQDSIYHDIFIGFDIDYGNLPLADIRQLNFDLKILDQDEINWFLDAWDFDACNGQTGYNVDTTGFAIDSIASIQFEFENGINARRVICQNRITATVAVVIEARSSNNLRDSSEPELNNQCSFRQKADLFIAVLNPIVTLADLSISAIQSDTLIQREWLKTCGLPNLQLLEYDTHFEVESYNNDTVVIELMLRYNDDYSIINGDDTLYFSTGNIRFLFDSLGLANPKVLPCDDCAAYTTTGSVGNLVSFNYQWLTDYKVATKQRLALIEFDIIQPIDTVCARLIYNEPPEFPYTRIFNTATPAEELSPAGYDILIFCPKKYKPELPF